MVRKILKGAGQVVFGVTAFFAVLIGVILVGANWESWTGSDAPTPPVAQQNDLWMQKAQESVREQLKDAGSAEFRNVAIRDYKGAPFVCGEVNAKNGFGGYSGYQQFIFAGSMGTLLSEHMKPGEMTKAWSEFCAG